MIINVNTKIAALLKECPDALESIISISPKFEKLRNPILRKIMARRTSIAMASKIGGCKPDDFFNKLEPLGFSIDREQAPVIEEKKEVPEFILTLDKNQVTDLDVRPIIASGNDPLHAILQSIKTIKPGGVLKIINTFEPTPLIMLLGKQGFTSYVETIEDDRIETYFCKPAVVFVVSESYQQEGWEKLLLRFTNHTRSVDVRQMEMPKPMLTILGLLDELEDNTALYVYHKRVPVFLLPELADRHFDYRIKEISENEVHLLIFKDR